MSSVHATTPALVHCVRIVVSTALSGSLATRESQLTELLHEQIGREEGLSPTAVACFHKLLHLALEKAVCWNLVPRNVCDTADPPRIKHYEIKPLSQEQVQQLLVTASGHRLEALFVLVLSTLL